MGEYKAKPIQTNLGTLRHDQTYPGIIQAYSGIFRTLCYPDIFYNCGISRTQNHIQNQKLIQNPGIFRTVLYSERWHIQNPRHIQNPVCCTSKMMR